MRLNQFLHIYVFLFSFDEFVALCSSIFKISIKKFDKNSTKKNGKNQFMKFIKNILLIEIGMKKYMN